MDMNNYPIVHIYSQYAYHMEAFILGNEKGLIAIPYTADYAQDKTGISPSSFLK